MRTMRTLDELGISPAPWRVNDDEYGDPNEVLCDYICDEFQKGQKRTRVIAETNHHFAESENDACLIAAAPELYEALRKTIVALQNRLPKEPTLDESEIVIAAYAALAKASGEEAAREEKEKKTNDE